MDTGSQLTDLPIAQVPDPDPRVRAVFANQAEWLLRLANATAEGPSVSSPGRPVWRGDDLIAAQTGASGVLLSPPDRTPDGDELDAAITWLQSMGTGNVLIWSATASPDLDGRLLARGAEDSFRPHWMARSLLTSPLPHLAPERIEVGIAGIDDLSDLLITQGIPYLEPEQVRTTIQLASVPEPDRHVCLLLARERRWLRAERIVGHVTIHLSEYDEQRIAGIYNLGVHRNDRRRGIGTALTVAALEQARAWDVSVVGLNATPDGEPVYRRLGFTTVGTGQTWFLSTDRLRQRPDPALVYQAESIARGDIAALSGGSSIAASLPNGESPLRFAARFEQVDIARWLLKQGAAGEIVPLWRLGLRSEVETLFSDLAAVNQRSGTMQTTPLHEAIHDGDIDLAARLIAAGANLSAIDATYHSTPLGWARALNQPEIAALIERGSRKRHAPVQ